MVRCFQAILRPARVLRTLAALAVLFLVAGCSEYWWSRGQPLSVDVLLQRSQQKLEFSLRQFSEARPPVASLAREIEGSLLEAVSAARANRSPEVLKQELARTETKFIALEGKLSVGSRAPYGELAGQLRAFNEAASRGQSLGLPALGLFAARTLSFLANELSVPSPGIG